MSKKNQREAVFTWLQQRGFAYTFNTSKVPGEQGLRIIWKEEGPFALHREFQVPLPVVMKGLLAVKAHLRKQVRQEALQQVMNAELHLERAQRQLKTCADFLKA